MSFGSRAKVKKCKRANITLKGERLKLVPTYKYLGVLLDSTLSYKSHISSVLRNVQHKVSMLSKVKRYLTTDVAVQIYKSMLLPYFDYADVIFNKANATDLDKLQRLQNRCLRLCLGHNRFYGTDEAHAEASVPFLKNRRKAHVLNFMYIRKDTKPNLLNRREIRTRAHDAPLFTVKIPRCEAYKRSVGYSGAETWNGLPPNVRNLIPFKTFKEHQKKEMLTGLDVN